MRTYFLSAALLLASSATSAHGSGLWVGSTVGFCLVQHPAYASLPGGKHWLQQESIPRFIASLPPELHSCLKANKAATAPLCRALLTPSPNDITNQQYEQMEVKFREQLASFSTMNCGHAPR